MVNEYTLAVTIISALGGGLWGIVKFREYLRDRRFKAYHELVDELVNEQKNPDRHIKLDRQIAIVYELRNFPGYFPVSLRILTDLKELWPNSRIKKEIDFSIRFMNSNWLERRKIQIMKTR